MASGNPENPGFGQVTDHPSRLGSGRMIRQSLRLGETRRLVPVSAYTGDPIRRYGFQKSGKSRIWGVVRGAAAGGPRRRPRVRPMESFLIDNEIGNKTGFGD
ncbi:hypothetical protein DdX_04526 [Ditylenchus destructor]|uniref:Uncharacterized protein n=1 Tax=Ditylenchus destructor TaxID=166010 RepID=A0AAD4N9R0_9BILA|nr:hypothetical protein DdX_04526 [Ditylenchus destructor]